MNTGKVIDWLAEPRHPHHFPSWIRRAIADRGRRGGRPEGELSLALTFDVEQDPGADPVRWDTCPPFLRWLAELSDARGWETTLFVQGAVAEPLVEQLGPMLPHHQIGLHGHYHELWGRPLWFARYLEMPKRARRERLAMGIEAFARAGLPRPRSFRAPYLVCDDFTLDLLEEAGFELDSSAAAFRGCAPVVSRRGRLVRVPVSASPALRLRRRLGLPTWAPFGLLNVPTFLFAPEEELARLVDEILAVQRAHGSPPHLVVLAHPWEFAEYPLPGCSVGNRERLVARVDWLRSRYPLAVTRLESIVARASQ